MDLREAVEILKAWNLSITWPDVAKEAIRTLIRHAERVKQCDQCQEWCENAFDGGCLHWCQDCFEKEAEAWGKDWEKHCAEVLARKESTDVQG